jgi:hypothetical protein
MEVDPARIQEMLASELAAVEAERGNGVLLHARATTALMVLRGFRELGLVCQAEADAWRARFTDVMPQPPAPVDHRRAALRPAPGTPELSVPEGVVDLSQIYLHPSIRLISLERYADGFRVCFIALEPSEHGLWSSLTARRDDGMLYTPIAGGSSSSDPWHARVEAAFVPAISPTTRRLTLGCQGSTAQVELAPANG